MTLAEELHYAQALAPHVVLVVTLRPPTLLGPTPQERIQTALLDMNLDPALQAQMWQARAQELPNDSPPREHPVPRSEGAEENLINLDTPLQIVPWPSSLTPSLVAYNGGGSGT